MTTPAPTPAPEPTGPSHPRETFNGYAQHVDIDGDWGYIVDDFGDLSYVRGQWYPFNRAVRLAPDTCYQAWVNQYVMVRPTKSPKIAAATLHLTVRSQGWGAAVVFTIAVINMATGQVMLSHIDLDEPLVHEARTKAAKVLALLTAERMRATTRPHPPAPITAHDRYTAAQAEQNGVLW